MKIQFDVYGMSCQVCANRINKAVSQTKGVKTCNVNFVNNSMFVEYDERVTNTDFIIKAVVNAGYNAKVKTNVKKETKHEVNSMVFRLVVSIIFLIPLLYITMGYEKLPQFSFIDYHVKNINMLYYFLLLLILTVPILLVNIKYYIKGLKDLFTLHPSMDSLIAIGSGTAFVYTTITFFFTTIIALSNNDRSYLSYLNGNYYDSAAMIVTIVTIGKMLESKAKHKTTLSIDKLVQLIPEYAIIIENGEEVSKSVSEIKVGDLVVIKTGMRVPVDGIVVEGESTLDTSTITGESIGTYVSAGSSVISSSLNQGARIVIEASTVGSDSTMQKIIDLVNEAANSKAPISRIADEVSKFFVPVVMIIALITFLIWLLVKNDLSNAIKCGVSVLVVSCPCALGLATPVAIMASVGKGTQFGVISKSAEAIEIASRIETVVLDKTGTITEGTPKVVSLFSYGVDEKEVIQVAYSLENGMVHPLSNAIVEYASKFGFKPYKVESPDFVPGVGILGVVNGRNYFLGNIEYVELYTRIAIDIRKQIHENSKKGYITLLLTKESEVVGLICIADKIKKSSIQAIKVMKDMGIKVIMATGDNESTATAIGNIVGVDEVRSRVLPQEKEDIIKHYQGINKKKTKKVAMIGDGINDSLALVRSDLGVAIGAGSDIAIDYCDIILLKSDLLDAANMLRLEKETMKIIKLNLFWALCYNVILIPMATGLLSFGNLSMNPMLSAIAMSCSSLFVVCTALTINWFKPIEYNEAENVIKKESKEELIGDNTMKKIVIVNGMSCEHCSARVKKAIEALPNVVNVNVNLKTKEVEIEYKDSLNLNLVKEAVEKIDYEFIG